MLSATLLYCDERIRGNSEMSAQGGTLNNTQIGVSLMLLKRSGLPLALE